MSPNELLRAAATRARELDAAATKAPWYRAADHEVARAYDFPDNAVGYWDGEYSQCVVYMPHGDGQQAEAEADARATAAARSVLGPLADLLEAEALLVTPASTVLAVARALLGERVDHPKDAGRGTKSLAEIDRQRDLGWLDFHPESYCHRCGGPNVTSWCAPSPLWNAVMRGGSIDNPEPWNGIICPTCFAELAEHKGVAELWRFYAERVHVELETVTPSGRVWNPDTWLWETDAAT